MNNESLFKKYNFEVDLKETLIKKIAERIDEEELIKEVESKGKLIKKKILKLEDKILDLNILLGELMENWDYSPLKLAFLDSKKERKIIDKYVDKKCDLMFKREKLIDELCEILLKGEKL